MGSFSKKIIVIVAHPSVGSFNFAIAQTVVETLQAMDHAVTFYDLYRANFNPVVPANEIRKGGYVDPTILTYCDEVASCDAMIFIHPNWWGMPPAILTGWIDRVIRPGVAYRFVDGDSGEGVPEGLLKGKTVLVINTSDTPDEREQKLFGDPLDRIWKKCVFDFCGIDNCHRKVFNIVVTSTPDQRAKWLGETRELVASLF
ncbi:MAG TPA: NAD(P)H-dependent oxidoreductase [Spirochaetota bacterium]